MNLSRLAIVSIAIALFTFGCSKTDEGASVGPKAPPASTPAALATPDEFAAARLTYTKSCAGCHGVSGEGGTAEVEGKKIKAPPLASGHALSHSDSDFVKQINKGGDGMPAFADKISAKEIEGLVAFIRSLQPGSAKSNARVDVQPDSKTSAVKKIAPVVK